MSDKSTYRGWKRVEVPAEYKGWSRVPVKTVGSGAPVPDDATIVDRPDVSPQGPEADESAYLGAVQGGTYGFGDEIAGALSTLGERGRRALVKAGLLDPKVDKWGEVDDPAVQAEGVMGGNVYERERNSFRDLNTEAKTAHPGAYTAGEVAGQVATSMAVPGSGSGGLVRAAARGALEGGANALGRSDSDSVVDAGKETLEGAALGGALSAGGRYVGDKIGKAVQNGAVKALGVLRDTSRTQAAKAAGIVGEGAQEVGDDLLETGSIRFGDTAKKIAARIEANQGQLGRKLADTLDEYGEKFDMKSFSKRAEDEILAEMRINGIVDPARRDEAAQTILMLRRYGQMADKGPIPFSTVQTMRESLEKNGSDGAKALSRLFGEEMSDQFARAEQNAVTAAGLTGDALEDATLDAAGKGTDVWLNSRTGASLARAGESAKELAKSQAVGMKDAAVGGGLTAAGGVAGTILGGPGAGTVGGAATGAALGVGKKVVQDRLPATLAVGAQKAAVKIFDNRAGFDAAGPQLSKVGEGVGRAVGKTTWDALKESYAADPQSWGAIGSVIFEGKTPDQQISAFHVLQQTDPRMQAKLKQMQNGGSDIEL